MPTCTAQTALLGHADRDYISWPTVGIDPGGAFVVTVELEENGTHWPLDIGIGEVVGWFAGPDFSSPGGAHVVPVTSHCQLHVTSDVVDVTLDGGFIQLVR